MEYIDKPKPSLVILALPVGVLIAVVFVVPTLIVLHGGARHLIGYGFMGFIPVALIILVIHAAYTLEYRISKGILELRAGWIMDRQIEIRHIKEIRSVRTGKFEIRGWTWGYCNRFTNLLALRTPKLWILVCPADVEAFREALEWTLSWPGCTGETPVPQ